MEIKSTLRNFLTKHSRCNDQSPLVLIWELDGFPPILVKNAIYSAALKTRGYNSHFLICDGTAEACIQRGLEQDERIENWPKKCVECVAGMRCVADKYNVKCSFVSDYISIEQRREFQELSELIDIKDIRDYKYLGNNVGVFAWDSLNRYMKGHLVELKDIRNEEEERIYRRYFYASLVHTHVANVVIRKLKPVSVLTSHGVFVDYAPPISEARLKGLNYVSWDSGYADFLHYFSASESANEPGLRGISKIQWQKIKTTSLTDSENRRLDDYMYNRYFKGASTDLILKSSPENPEALKRKLHIDNDNPTIVLFAHVNWDAVLGSRAMLFDNANQWVVESVKKMSEIKDVNWIIKMHPGEVSDGTLFTTYDVIQKEFDSIPDHIKIIRNDTEINTYGLYQLVDAGITVLGTAGAELPLSGKPIITTGEAHYSGKGFSIDAKSKEEYFSILENARDLKPLTDGQKELARRYAYSYFVQSQVPLKIMNKKEGHWGNIDLTRLEELLPGNDPILDKICEGIIHGKDVILDEEITCGGTEGISDLKEVYSADQQGKVIVGANSVFRIIHKNEEANIRKILDLIGEDFESLQIVDTKIVSDKNVRKQLNVSEGRLVLEHRRISSITYPHEWPPSMLQDAALFHLKLSAALLPKDLHLKDAHPLNILFESGKPVLVDFASIVTKEALFNERYLRGNSKYNNEPENIRISVLILEIYKRMFLPYFYIPLCAYAFGNKKSIGTIIHETTLNTSKRATALTSAINEYELNSPQVADNLRQVEKIFENFVSDLDANRLFDSLYRLIQELPIASRKSGYTNYYEKKGENQDYTQMEDFNEKQEAVFKALNQESIESVLDIGANTGWYSLMAEHMGKRVLSLDTDAACIELLYEKVKESGINIQPIIADFAKLSSECPSLYDNKPVLLDGYYRFRSDSVMVLGLLHHLVLGLGMGFDEIFSKIDLLSSKQLILEYVSIDDSLIQAEPDFFPAYYRDPNGFGFYNLDNLLRTLKKFCSDVEVKWSTKDTRMILVCRKRQDKNNNACQAIQLAPAKTEVKKLIEWTNIPDSKQEHPSLKNLLPELSTGETHNLPLAGQLPSKCNISTNQDSSQHYEKLLKRAYHLIGQNNFAPALNLLEQVKGAFAHTENFQYARAVCLWRLGRFAEAAIAAQQELDRYPGNDYCRRILETYHNMSKSCGSDLKNDPERSLAFRLTSRQLSEKSGVLVSDAKKQLVIVGSAHRVGSTWLYSMLKDIGCFDSGTDLIPKKYDEYGTIVLKDPEVFKYLNRLNGRFIFKSHSYPVISEIAKDIKFVTVIRDPRDVIVSNSFYLAHLDPEKGGRDQSFRELSNVGRIKRLIGDGEFILSRLEQWFRSPIAYNVRYEDLKTNPVRVLEAVLRYLELPVDEEQIRRIAAKHSFKSLTGRNPGEDCQESPNRKGIVGDWRNYFNKDCIAAFKKEKAGYWNHLLVEMGYETNLDWHCPVSQIDSGLTNTNFSRTGLSQNRQNKIQG